MAYVGSTNNTLTTTTVSQDVAYAMKTALVAAGWTVQGSSNGTTWNNTASGDNLPNYAAWNAAGSWVRLREPSGPGGREYVIMRGSGTGIIIKYSRSVGFGTGGGPTTLPTTGASGDGVVWWGPQFGYSATGTGTNTYDQASLGTGQQTLITISSNGYISCVASTTAVNGVYGFWLIAYASGTATLQFQLFSEGVDSASCSPLDYDPSVRQYSGNNWWANDLPSANLVHYWQGYPSPWSSPTTAIYRVAAPLFTYFLLANTTMVPTYSIWPQAQGQVPAKSPYNGKYMMYPTMISTLNVVGGTPKGMSTGFLQVYGAAASLEVMDPSSASPRILYGSVYSNPIQFASIPWVTNVQPLV